MSDWREGIGDARFIPGVVLPQMPDVARRLRAIEHGAVEYIGAGMTGVVFCAGSRAFKVARDTRPIDHKFFDDEAEWLEAASRVAEVAPHVAKFHSFDRVNLVIVRACPRTAPDMSPYRYGEDKLHALHGRIEKAMLPHGWTSPEFKADSYVITSEGPVLVDASMPSRVGVVLVEYIADILAGRRAGYENASTLAFELRREVQMGTVGEMRAAPLLAQLERMSPESVPGKETEMSAAREAMNPSGVAVEEIDAGEEAARGGMTPEQREAIVTALQRYGAGLSEDGFIVKDGKVLSVKPEVSKGRLRMMANGNLLASFPASRISEGVSAFVERFWFWKPLGTGAAESGSIGGMAHGGYPYKSSANGRYILLHDGKETLRGTEQDIWSYLHRYHSYSVEHAIRYEGYSVVPEVVGQHSDGAPSAHEDYLALTNDGRRAGGPYRHYDEAKREAEKVGGYVQFAGEEASRTRTYHGVVYFPSYQEARVVRDRLVGMHPEVRIVQYERGWAVQYYKSGPYYPEYMSSTESAREDFPTSAAAFAAAKPGDFVYHEAGKFHIAGPGQAPGNATLVGAAGEHGSLPVKAIATKQGMMKGYWRVVVVDAEGHDVETVERVQSKKLAEQWAAEINKRGSYTTGISGFRYEQKLGAPLRHGASETVAEVGEANEFAVAPRDTKAVARGRKLPPLKDARAVYEYVKPHVEKMSQEVFLTCPVDLHGTPLSDKPFLCAMGQRDRVAIEMSDALRPVGDTNAAGVVFSHLHPSGHARKSKADQQLTIQLKKSLAVAYPGVAFLDHVIVAPTGGEYYSFTEDKLYKV